MPTLIQLAARCAGQHHHYYDNPEYPLSKAEMRGRLEHAARFCQRMTDELKALADAERRQTHCACVFSNEYPEDGALSTCNYHTAEMDTATSELEAEHRADCIAFFCWWYNQPGSNTEQGYDQWRVVKELEG